MRSAFRVLERACRPLVESLETRRLLSVVLSPEQTQDWGDLPDSYQTLLASNGARHFASSVLLLGTVIDAEGDGQPSVNADADDLNPLGMPDDEDGVTLLTPLVPGQMATVQVFNGGTMPGFLNAWLDFANNSTFADPIDHVIVNFPANPGPNVVQFLMPNVGAAQLYARFRLSQQPGISWFGDGGEGEVEDYRFRVEEPGIYDFGDAPDSYGTTLAANGAQHTPNSLLMLGQIADYEVNGQPSPLADADDLNPPLSIDDEDGITFLNALVPGGIATVQVVTTGPGAIDAWVDFNINGVFDAGDQIFTAVPVPGGPVVLNFPVPAGIAVGQTYARFRLSQQGGLAPTGFGGPGEVEDYLVRIEEPELLDFGDAPDTYGTTLAANGARHLVTPGLFLGAAIDAELDGQPSPNADADDLNPPMSVDDEDGIVILDPVVPGANVRVNVTNGGAAGVLDAWMDFNLSGAFDPGEQIFTAAPLPASATVQLVFPVPIGIQPNVTSYARFRLSNGVMAIGPTGPGGSGEVEDYRVRFEEPELLDFGDAPDLPQGFAFPTIYGGVGNPARHAVVANGPILGKLVDLEANGQPTIAADGDDVNPPITIDDEDGVFMASGPPLDQSWIWAGNVGNLVVTNGGSPVGSPAFLNVWADVNQSGAWAHPGERVVANMPLPPGMAMPVTIPAPLVAPPGRSFMYVRFRLSTQGNLADYGPAQDGEVEDYRVLVVNLLKGDMNGDGVVNNQDIAGFVLALTNPAQFPIQYPSGDIIAGDVNMDGVVNNQDIAPFVQLLTGPRPAPTIPPGIFSRKPVVMKTAGEGLAVRLFEQLDVDRSSSVLSA